MKAAWFGALGVVAATVVIAWWLPSCSNNSCQGQDCSDAGSVPPISGGGCDSSKPPSQGGCAVADSDGFFVSPKGSDSADGSKATPFLTIGKGISAATGAPSRPNVYICAGTYPETLTIQNAPQGVALHGGFSCTDWSTGGGTTEVAPAYVPAASAQPQYVLRVLGAAALVETMTLTAPDATDPGASSIATFVDTSPGMTFRRAMVTAGKGADGASPTQQATATPNAAGNGNSGGGPGADKSCTCGSDVTIGGQGGGYLDAGYSNPTAGSPLINGDNTKGQPGIPGNCNGGTGADGLAPTTAGPSASSYGQLSSNGWSAAAGGVGPVGGIAQGGGGGYGDPGVPFAGGGGGGCGGCGGSGGSGAGGGGASIALAALNTVLRLQAATLHGGQAGAGGTGGPGQAGQPGGGGGQGYNAICNGGTGGAGGVGGAGGGGAGGVSLGIASVNTTPDIDAQSSVLGGKAGTGGHDGASPPAGQGVDGVAEAFHNF